MLATSLDDVGGDHGRGCAASCSLVDLVVLLLGAVAALAAVRGSLRPLVRIEETARGHRPRATSPAGCPRRAARAPRSAGSRRALNGMLSQLEVAFAARAASEERMRRFMADASHELRTPLTSIQGFAELYRQGAVTGTDELDRLMGRIEGESLRMAGLVEDLLLLARLDEQRPLRRDVVDLVVLAADAVHDARAAAPEHTVRLDLPAGRRRARRAGAGRRGAAAAGDDEPGGQRRPAHPRRHHRRRPRLRRGRIRGARGR